MSQRRSISKANPSNKSKLPTRREAKTYHWVGAIAVSLSIFKGYIVMNMITLCPICNGDHKEKTIWNNIKGEWGSGEYCGE
jgi:hypothetical protein